MKSVLVGLGLRDLDLDFFGFLGWVGSGVDRVVSGLMEREGHEVFLVLTFK